MTTVEVDLNKNELRLPDKTVRLAPQQAEIMYLLVQAAPQTVPNARLIKNVWPGKQRPKSPEAQLSVYVSSLRKALENSDWVIVCSRKRGYMLLHKADKQAA